MFESFKQKIQEAGINLNKEDGTPKNIFELIKEYNIKQIEEQRKDDQE
jgi:hypothetical protein